MLAGQASSGPRESVEASLLYALSSISYNNPLVLSHSFRDNLFYSTFSSSKEEPGL